jgi:hypothetical protein
MIRADSNFSKIAPSPGVYQPGDDRVIDRKQIG